MQKNRTGKVADTTKLMMEAPKESLTTQKILERRKRFQKTGDFAAARQQTSEAATPATSSYANPGASGGGQGAGAGSNASVSGFTKEQLAKREKLLAMIAKNKASSGGAAKPKPVSHHGGGGGFGWRNAWTPAKEQAKQALSDSLPTTP